MSAIEKEKPDMTEAPTAAKPGPDVIGFDPAKPVRCKDGRKVTDLAVFQGKLHGNMPVEHSFQWNMDGTYWNSKCPHLDLENVTPDTATPRDPVTRPDGGEDDVAFVEYQAARLRVFTLPTAEITKRLIALARCGASAPAAGFRCPKCGNNRYEEWCPYCDTESRTRPQAAPAATGAVDDAERELRKRIAREVYDYLCISGDRQERIIGMALTSVIAPTPPSAEAMAWAKSVAERVEQDKASGKTRPLADFKAELRNRLAATPAGSTPDGGCTSVVTSGDTDDAVPSDIDRLRDEFRGDDDALVQSIAALIAINDDGVLSPELPQHASKLLSAAALRLSRTTSPPTCAEPVTEAKS